MRRGTFSAGITGVCALLATLISLAAPAPADAIPVCTDGYMNGPPRAQCGNRIFPEAHLAQGYIQFTKDPATGFAEYRHGIEYLAQSYKRWVSVTTLSKIYGDLDAVSVGPDRLRSYHLLDTDDGRDIPVLKITDHTVPDGEKQALFFSLSVHGNERGGLEGGLRTAEDLAVAASCLEARETTPTSPVAAGDPCTLAGVACEDNARRGCTMSTHISDAATSPGTGKPNYESATGLPPEVRRHAVDELLEKQVLYLVDFNSDGWAMGDVWGATENGLRAPLYNRGNQLGTDLNRQMPTVGRINPSRNPLQESEMLYGTRFMHDVADAAPGGKMAYGADIHGELTSQAYMDIMYPAGQFDSVDHRRLMAIAERTKSVIDETLYAGIMEEAEQATVGNEEEAPQNVVPQRPAHWATVWDTLGYTDTGFIGDYMATDLGVTGMDYEIAFNHTVPEKVWNVYLQENHINATRGIIKTAMAYALSQESDYSDETVRVDTVGRAGYVVNPVTVTDTDANGAGTKPGPNRDGIGADGRPVEQRPYDVTNQQWFRDTSRLMDKPFVPLASADVAGDPEALDAVDTLVLADVGVPADVAGRGVDTAAYWSNIKAWVERGGNLVLTDRAIHGLARLGVGVAADSIADTRTYMPYADFRDFGHPMTEGLRPNARQLVEAAVLGYGIGSTATFTTTVASSAWTALGGTVVGTTTADRVSVGQAKLGDGQIRIVGGALPMPTEDNDHRYGLRDYAPTYTGLYLLENSIRHDHPDLGKVGPKATRISLAESATSGQYTDEVTLRAHLETVKDAEPLDGAVVTFDLLSGDKAVASWTGATDDGTIAVPARLLAKPGRYELVARYAGDAATYLATTASTAFELRHEDVGMTLVRTGKGNTGELVARLSDGDDSAAPLFQKIVNFTANGSRDMGSDVTDGNGEARVGIGPRFRGDETEYTAAFAGDEYFSPQSRTIVGR